MSEIDTDGQPLEKIDDVIQPVKRYRSCIKSEDGSGGSETDDDDANKLKLCVNNIAMCPICLESLRNPRSLPCLHSFCIDCLDQFYLEKQAGDDSCCPMCRAGFLFPFNGVGDFPHNFLVSGLMQADASIEYCIKHESKIAEMFCFSCKTGICYYCYTKAHSQHSCQRIKLAKHRLSAQICHELEQLSAERDAICKETSRLDGCQTAFVCSVRNAEERLRQKSKELKESVDKEAHHLQREITEFKTGTVNEFESLKSKLNRRVEEISCALTLSSAIYEERKCSVLADRADAVGLQVSDSLHSILPLKKQFPSVGFTPNSSQHQASVVGKLTVDSIVAGLTSAGEFNEIIQTEHFNCIEADTDVWGVAVLNDEIFAVCKHSNTISKFAGCGENLYSRLPGIVVEGMLAASDIVSFEADDFLFVADSAGKCLWRIIPRNKSVELWLSEEIDLVTNFVPWSLSVGHSRLLVVVLKCLMVIDIRSKDLKRITLPKDMDPFHALETARGSFIVCHTCIHHGGITELDMHGQPIRSYFTVIGYQNKRLEWPCYAVYVGEGFVVLDYESNDVLLLDSELSRDTIVLRVARDGLVNSRRMCYSSRSSTLLICNGNKICMYHFRKQTK